MIDLSVLLGNSLWVLGLTVLLATFSWASWVAQREGARFREVCARSPGRRWTCVGLALFCAGAAATGRSWWEQVLWTLLAAAWAVGASSGIAFWLFGARKSGRDHDRQTQ